MATKEKEKDSGKNRVIVIIGAGVAGLAIAYGLEQAAARGIPVTYRIFERRTEYASSSGFPIHLSPTARKSLKSLLTPKDFHVSLHDARQRIPVTHEGVTFHNESGKVVLAFRDSEDENTMVERRDLIGVLRERIGLNGFATIEFGRSVIGVENGLDGVSVLLDDGERVIADVVVGADGMFSKTRELIYPNPRQAAYKLGCSAINIRSFSPSVRACLKDPNGINVTYGKSWSATSIPLGPEISDGVYVVLTVPTSSFDTSGTITVDEDEVREVILSIHSDSPLIRALQKEGVDDGAQPWTLYSTRRTVTGLDRRVEGRRIILVGDASHGMVPFCGCGASAAITDAVELVKVLENFDYDLDKNLAAWSLSSKRRNDPLLIASRVLLWLAQGEVPWKRALRDILFGSLGGPSRLKASIARRLKRTKIESLKAE